MSKELYVGSISQKATEEDLRKLFSVVGTVTSVHLIRDPDTGDFKGCGYVRMATPEQIKEAVTDLDGALLIDREITVSVARPQPPQKKGRPGGNRRSAPAGRGGGPGQKRRT